MSLLDALLPAEPTPPTPTAGKPSQNTHDPLGTDGIAGSGTLNDPYDASTQAKFDAVMSLLPDKPMRVLLGSIGIKMADEAPPNNQNLHGHVIIRNNRIRAVDSVPAASNAVGVEAYGATALIIAENMIDLAPSTADPIQAQSYGTVTIFDNRNPDGELVVPDSDHFETKFEAPSQDAFTAANFHK
jgi:hypothetical protein